MEKSLFSQRRSNLFRCGATKIFRVIYGCVTWPPLVSEFMFTVRHSAKTAEMKFWPQPRNRSTLVAVRKFSTWWLRVNYPPSGCGKFANFRRSSKSPGWRFWPNWENHFRQFRSLAIISTFIEHRFYRFVLKPNFYFK